MMAAHGYLQDSAPMKISDYLEQRAKRHTYWYMASFIPMGLVLMFKPDSFPFIFGSLIIMFAALIAFMLLSSRAPCPRCSRPLGIWSTWLGKPKRDYQCSHCNVSIDEPMESAANKPRDQDLTSGSSRPL